ncbi:MAG: anti-sigma factor [Acidobacteria bacterium]|nr:anti-sigma factor [Acidobacteriota bacterium]
MTLQLEAHREWLEATTLLALGALEEPDRETAEVHVQHCQECQREMASLQRVLTGLGLIAPRQAPAPQLRERVVTAALASARSSKTSEKSFKRLTQSDSFAQSKLEKLPTSPLQAPVVRRTRTPMFGAAALLVLTLALGTYLTQAHVNHVEARLQEASTRTSAAERHAAEAQYAASQAQSVARVLAAPDVRHFGLIGLASSPTAFARALWSPSRGLVLSASNLPAPPSGHVYQVWLLTSQGPISAGLLSLTTTDEGSLIAQAPAGLPTPVGVAISLEAGGGATKPTGPLFLSTTSS